ncbi:MAG: RagB/SusD family nutrient uptake outer membrane protein [Candidatus Pseudobacter hemicellulosilyticus]|uniref:RagB/SusD family nutrient uptake outer membrane protein n=1 Tax=Candidatus Pseudobacter hemicellulosilyticus TaxID=3121375 RepID=A0AAJ6BKC9_9BACT|nr:MAG: RagB/SusD family nutrient uptake outer membrane protein [Pseudobacter sp.]
MLSKKYSKLIYLALPVLLLCQGCEKYLDKSPDLGLSEDAVYKDYTTVRGFLDVCFNYLDHITSAYYNGNERAYPGILSDEMATTDNDSKALLIHSGNWLLTAKDATYELGVTGTTPISNAYKAIRIANLVLANYTRVPGMTAEQTNEIVGQAHFYRAWFYFDLLKRYGGMPIFDKAYVGDGDEDVPRVSYHESHAWMMQDIEAAISMLPAGWDDANTGRPTKVAAMAFKSMAELYDASPLMQNGLHATSNMGYDQERAKKAAQSASALLRFITENTQLGYRMATAAEYKNIFYFTAPPHSVPEYLWYNRKATNDMKRTIRNFWLYASLAEGTGPEGASICMPTQNMVDLFEKKGPDGNYYPIQHSAAQYNGQEPFKDRDPRFYNNILTPGTQWGYNVQTPLYITTYAGGAADLEIKTLSPSNKRQTTGYLCKKFLWPEANRYTAQWAKYRYMTCYIRMAQIYLDLAEASFEATGSATAKVEGCELSALEALNIVRNRIGITDLPADIAGNPDQFREAYRRERAVELMFEHHRWWDIRRWMIAQDLFKATYPIKGMMATPTNPNHESVANKSTLTYTFQVTDVVPEIRNFQLRNYWYPFPQADVASLKNLIQNPGW